MSDFSINTNITANDAQFNATIDDTIKSLDDFSAAFEKALNESGGSLDELAGQISAVDDKAQIWGDNTSTLGDKQKILKDKINQLIDQGLKPEDEQIKDLKESYDALGREQETLSEKHTASQGKIQRGLKEWGIDVEKIGEKGKAFFNQWGIDIDKMAGKLGMSGPMLAGIVGIGTVVVTVGAKVAKAISGMVEDFAEFETKITEVFTLLPGLTEDAMDDMTDQVKDFSKEFGVLPEETIPALYQALSAGVPEGSVFDFLADAQEAAVGGVTDLQTAVDGLSSVVNAYGEDVIDVSEVSDAMFTTVRLGGTTFEELAAKLFNVVPIAASLGIKFDEVSAMLAEITASGTPTAQATTQIRQAFVELGDSTTDVSKIFQQITGTSFKDFIASGGHVNDALNLLYDYSVDANVGVNELFGSVEAGQAVLQTTGSHAESLAAKFGEFETKAGATTDAFGLFSETFDQTNNRFKAAVDVLKIDIGDAFEPLAQIIITAGTSIVKTLDSVITGITEFLSPIRDLLKDMVPLVDGIVTAFVGFAGFAAVAIAVKKFSDAMKILNVVLTANPYIAIAAGVAALAVAVGQLVEADQARRVESLTNEFEGLYETLEITDREMLDFADTAQQVQDILAHQDVTGNYEETARNVRTLAVQFGLSAVEVAKIGIASGNLSDSMKDVLQSMVDQREASLALEASGESRTGWEREAYAAIEQASAARQEAVTLAEAEAAAIAESAASEAARTDRINNEYIAARQSVLDILGEEESTYTQLQAQLDELIAHPWYEGTDLEADRLRAIEILNEQILEEEQKTADERNRIAQETLDFQTQWEETAAAAYLATLETEREAAIQSAIDKNDSLESVLNTAIDYDNQILESYTNSIEDQRAASLAEAEDKNADAETVATINQYYDSLVTEYATAQAEERTRISDEYTTSRTENERAIGEEVKRVSAETIAADETAKAERTANREAALAEEIQNAKDRIALIQKTASDIGSIAQSIISEVAGDSAGVLNSIVGTSVSIVQAAASGFLDIEADINAIMDLISLAGEADQEKMAELNAVFEEIADVLMTALEPILSVIMDIFIALAPVITAVVGVLADVITTIGAVITLVVDAITAFTDWIGITDSTKKSTAELAAEEKAAADARADAAEEAKKIAKEQATAKKEELEAIKEAGLEEKNNAEIQLNYLKEIADFENSWADKSKSNSEKIQDAKAAEISSYISLISEAGTATVALAGIQDFYNQQYLRALAEESQGMDTLILQMDSLQSATDSMYSSFANIGTDISNSLISGLSDGFTETDFLDDMKEYILNMVIQAAVYTDELKDQMAEIGAAIAAGISSGFETAELTGIKEQLSVLYQDASAAASAATSIVSSVFGPTQEEWAENMTNVLDSAGEIAAYQAQIPTTPMAGTFPTNFGSAIDGYNAVSTASAAATSPIKSAQSPAATTASKVGTGNTIVNLSPTFNSQTKMDQYEQMRALKSYGTDLKFQGVF